MKVFRCAGLFRTTASVCRTLTCFKPTTCFLAATWRLNTVTSRHFSAGTQVQVEESDDEYIADVDASALDEFEYYEDSEPSAERESIIGRGAADSQATDSTSKGPPPGGDWKQQMALLWKSVGMSNAQCKKMVEYGESRPLYRKHNLLSVRLAQFREVFPAADLCRVVCVMPSVLTEAVNSQLTDYRFALDRLLLGENSSAGNGLLATLPVAGSSGVSVDRLVTANPFILCKDLSFVESNIANYCALLQCTKKEVTIALDKNWQLLCTDATRAIAVKYGIIQDYVLSFRTRVVVDANGDEQKFAESGKNDSSVKVTHGSKSGRFPYAYATGKTESHGVVSTASPRSEAVDAEVTQLENKLKWAILREPHLLTTDWSKFGRIEFVHFVKENYGKYNRPLNVSRLFALGSDRMFVKFPQFRSYIVQRLVANGGCDESKVAVLSADDLEYAFGELICLENAPKSMDLEQLRQFEETQAGDLDTESALMEAAQNQKLKETEDRLRLHIPDELKHSVVIDGNALSAERTYGKFKGKPMKLALTLANNPPPESGLPQRPKEEDSEDKPFRLTGDSAIEYITH